MNREKMRLPKKLIEYGIVTIVSIGATFLFLRLWRADIRMPFSINGDAAFTLNLVRNMLQSGWVYQNDLLGAPFGHQLYDFPLGDTTHLLILKFLTFFTSNAALVINLYYLASYPLAVLTSYFVARKLSVSRLGAISIGLLFAFLPYHFNRGVNHFFYSLYYSIPLITLVFLRLFHDPIFFKAGKGPLVRRIHLNSWWAIYTILITLLIGFSGIYFAFFSLFFIAIAILSQLITTKRGEPVITGIVLGLLIMGAIVIQHIPNFIYFAQEGRNTAVAQRSPHESELYGLKMIHLILPIASPIHPVQRVREIYYASTPKNGDQSAYLGIAGSAGLLLLLIYLVKLPGDQKNSIMSRLSILNLSGLLLATVGGGSAIIAFTLFTQIRAYNRISIFLGFFCILAIVIGIEYLGKMKWLRHKWIVSFLLVLFISGSLAEQTRHLVPPYQEIKTYSITYSDYINQIEKQVPVSSQIFQLPYKEFPESMPVHNVTDYDLLRPSLFSNSLRWSYAAIKGREGDAWIKNIASLPSERMVEALAAKGFAGILVDRFGYIDGGTRIETQLKELTGKSPLTGVANRLAFYPLSSYFETRIATLSAQQRERLNTRYSQVVLRPGAGFFERETDGSNTWNWCLNELCAMEIVNFSDKELRATVELTVTTGYNRPSELVIQANARQKTYPVSNQATTIQVPVSVPAGISSISLRTTEEPFTVPNDPRFMYFQVINPFISVNQ